MILFKILLSRLSLFLFSCFLLLSIATDAQLVNPSCQTEKQWVDSVYNALTAQQRIGQLFMLRANSEALNTCP